MSAKRVFGIDLGTTYSCIAQVDEHGKPEVIQNAEGKLITPSAVYFESAENVVVGDPALEEAVFNPGLVVTGVKRNMGVAGAEYSFHDETYRPQEISAYILKKLAQDAEQNTGEEVEDVVITCPAYFGIEQKEATKQAGEIAGLNVLYVIPEPTAAAIAYGFEETEQEVILVYDLGGGTFDVTLIEVDEGGINVLSTGGDDQLGGKDWDGKIVEFLAEEFEKETGTSADELMEDQETLQNLMTDAEAAKRSLTRKESVTKVVRHGTMRANVELTRERFDELTLSNLERTIGFTESMIEKAQEKNREIDKMLLVGGSSYMPQVQERLADFDIEMQLLDPNLIVAKGAALFGYKYQLEQMIRIAIAGETGQQEGDVEIAEADPAVVDEAKKKIAENQGLSLPDLERLVEKRVVNVTSKSFGVVVIDGRTEEERVANLILKDDPVPKEEVSTFGTYEDGQDGVDLQLMENQVITGPDETVEMASCKKIGSAHLLFEHPLPKGSPIEIRFRLGPDGRLFMEAKDLETGKEIQAEYETESVMSADELKEAKKQALEMSFS